MKKFYKTLDSAPGTQATIAAVREKGAGTMTRKEVCKATGLSVKTLRLYEEKGLIAPAKEWRNGREYRAYTPELVAQLERIALLRRALFTMDEIREMQTHPDKISDIFQSYQQWLRQQEQQLHQLRLAADNIYPDTLSTLEDLLSGLQGAAKTMPLPVTDIKPNFKRLDELDEGPRHVEEQVDFDDMVPNAKVFRQMTVTVDRDRANDANIALGQLDATRRAFQEYTGTGPVQKTRKTPKWYNGLLAVLMILTVLFTCLAYFGRLSWVFAGISLLLCAGMLTLPLWMEHREWLKRAQQADAEATSPDAYAKGRRKRIYILAASFAGLLVLAGGIYLLAQVLYDQAHPTMDYRVCFVSPAYIPMDDLLAMEQTLAPLVGDRDGNGEILVSVDLNHVTGAYDWTLTDGLKTDTSAAIDDFIADGPYPLILIADVESGFFDLGWLKYPECCQRLPENLTGEISRERDAYRMDLTGCPMLEAAGLRGLTVYGCISKAASDAEYQFATELLQKISAG